MKASTIVLTLMAASGIALTATVALAQGYGPGAGRGMGGYGPQGANASACSQLFTAEERLAQHDRVHAATTFEQRQQLLTEHRTELQRRAAAQGIECNAPVGMGGGMMGGGYGRGMMGRGPGGQPGFFGGGGGAGGACGTQLFTVEEQAAWRDQMRAAPTFEQRQALADQHRAEARRRAAGRGVQCPGLTG